MDPVACCNLGLSRLGVKAVIAIDGSDPSKAGQLLAQQYETLRDAVTEARDWTFATKRYQLPLALDDAGQPLVPAFGYSSMFLLPPEVLRVVLCEPSTRNGGLDAFAVRLALEAGLDVSSLQWMKEGRYILAGAEGSAQGGAPLPAVSVKAIVKVPDAGQWDPCFYQCLAQRVAAELAVGLTSDASLGAAEMALYQVKLKDAASNDGRQGRAQKRRSNTLARRRL